jgi:hypothetical protein
MSLVTKMALLIVLIYVRNIINFILLNIQDIKALHLKYKYLEQQKRVD